MARSWLMISTVALLVILSMSMLSEAQSSQLLDISGFSWAENLIFDGNGNLFVSDAVTAKIWRIYYDTPSKTYKKTVHIDGGFKHATGLAVSADSQTVYANIELSEELGGDYAIVSFSPKTAGAYNILARLPKAGNGLALHFSTNKLYVTNEGGITNLGMGCVYEVDIETKTTSIFDSRVFTADGAWIDQSRHYLYVSDVLRARIHIYNLTSGTEISQYTIPNAVSLDDMCLTADGNELIGADFRNRSVIRWPANGKGSATVQVWDLKAPTSVRIGAGPNFNSGHIYITEGGGLTKFQTNRSVLERLPSPALPTVAINDAMNTPIRSNSTRLRIQ